VLVLLVVVGLLLLSLLLLLLLLLVLGTDVVASRPGGRRPIVANAYSRVDRMTGE
jgi:hypothetical protein